MQASPLVADYRQKQLPVAPYRGGLTRQDGGEAAVFIPAWPDSQRLLYDASWRAVLSIEGLEARKWLNGMITANVRDLDAGAVARSFQLDPKGHILADFDIAAIGVQNFLLLTSEDQRSGLLERLRKFVFISKLTIEDWSERLASLWVRGPGWERAWTAAGLPPLAFGAGAGNGSGDAGSGRLSSRGRVFPLDLEPNGAPPGAAWAIRSTRGGIEQVEMLAPATVWAWVWERLQPVCVEAGTDVLERDRILSAVPRYGADITESELPQETGQMDHLDFTKGCYIGQEIVERIRARGAVRRHWTRVALTGSATPGTEILLEGQVVGRLTSVVARDRDWLGLGYVRDPLPASSTLLQAGAHSAQVEAVIGGDAKAAAQPSRKP